MKEKKFNMPSVLVISGGHFFHDIYSHFLSPVLPLIISQLGITYSQAGLLTVFHRSPSLLNPYIGEFVSKKDPSLILPASIVISTTAMCFITVAPSYIILAVLIMTMGLSSCFLHILSPVMIKKYSGKRTGTGMSFYMLGGELARSAGPVIILGAVSIWGKDKVYYLLPAAYIYAGIVFLKFRKKPGTEDNRGTVRETGFFKVLREMKFFFSALLVILIARSSITSVLNAFLPAYMVSKGFSLWFSGVSLSILQFSGAAGTFFSGYISDRIGKNTALLIATAVSPILMFMFIFTTGAVSFVFLIMTGLSAFSISPVLLAYVQDRSGTNPTACSSIFMTADFLTISLSVVMAGFIGDRFGLSSAFITCSIISLAAFPSVILLKKRLVVVD